MTYTLARPLCDDSGMVSHEPLSIPNILVPGLTYLQQLNNLRAHSGFEPYEGEPFVCTGSAHLAGHHILCTSKAHQ